MHSHDAVLNKTAIKLRLLAGQHTSVVVHT